MRRTFAIRRAPTRIKRIDTISRAELTRAARLVGSSGLAVLGYSSRVASSSRYTPQRCTGRHRRAPGSSTSGTTALPSPGGFESVTRDVDHGCRVTFDVRSHEFGLDHLAAWRTMASVRALSISVLVLGAC